MARRSPAPLRIGWRVTSDFEPAFWLAKSAKAGEHAESDLVSIPPDALDRHTLLIAGSGSGKSFFLGRLLEELIVASKRARVLVLDPNSDFRRFANLRRSEDWLTGPKGPLYMTEARPKVFEERWPSEEIEIRVGDSDVEPPRRVRADLPWLKVAPDLIGDELEPLFRHDIFHCHRLLSELAEACELSGRPNTELPIALSEFFSVERGPGRSAGMRNALLNRFPSARKKADKGAFLHLIDRVVERSKSINDFVEHYYLSRLQRYQETGLLTYSTSWNQREEDRQPRVRVIDLPTFVDPSLALMAISAELRRVWELASSSTRTRESRVGSRYPQLVVIDEAHNLAPASTQNRAVASIRSELRRIVAEGRKYGLSLIIASQRPEKLDEFLISECENLALMRVPSRESALRLKERLHFDEQERPFENAARFGVGIVSLYGHWAKNTPGYLRTAGRRTLEGGLSLPSSAWR